MALYSYLRSYSTSPWLLSPFSSTMHRNASISIIKSLTLTYLGTDCKLIISTSYIEQRSLSSITFLRSLKTSYMFGAFEFLLHGHATKVQLRLSSSRLDFVLSFWFAVLSWLLSLRFSSSALLIASLPDIWHSSMCSFSSSYPWRATSLCLFLIAYFLAFSM